MTSLIKKRSAKIEDSPKSSNESSSPSKSPSKFFKDSSHLDPEFIKFHTLSIQISRNQLIEMVKYETKLRQTDETKKLFDNACRSRKFNLMPDIIMNIQKQVLFHFGFDPNNDDSISTYNLELEHFSSDPEIKNEAIWLKYSSKRKFGYYKEGDTFDVNNVIVHDDNYTNGIHIKLCDQLSDVTVILSGSISSNYFTDEVLPRIGEISTFFTKNQVDNVKIIVIYISESNPIDEYSISNKINVKQHITIEDRLVLSETIKNKFENNGNINVQFFADSLAFETSFGEKFSAWPERGYVIGKNENKKDFKVQYISNNKVNEYTWMDEMMQYLENNISFSEN